MVCRSQTPVLKRVKLTKKERAALRNRILRCQVSKSLELLRELDLVDYDALMQLRKRCLAAKEEDSRKLTESTAALIKLHDKVARAMRGAPKSAIMAEVRRQFFSQGGLVPQNIKDSVRRKKKKLSAQSRVLHAKGSAALGRHAHVKRSLPWIEATTPATSPAPPTPQSTPSSLPPTPQKERERCCPVLMLCATHEAPPHELMTSRASRLPSRRCLTEREARATVWVADRRWPVVSQGRRPPLSFGPSTQAARACRLDRTSQSRQVRVA